MGVAGSGERGMPLSWSAQMRDSGTGREVRYVFKLKMFTGGKFKEIRSDDPTLTDEQRRTIQAHLVSAHALKGVKTDLATSKRFNRSETGYHSESLETIRNAKVTPFYPPKTGEFAFKKEGDKTEFQGHIHEVWKTLQQRPGAAAPEAQAQEAQALAAQGPAVHVADQPPQRAEVAHGEPVQSERRPHIEDRVPPELHFPHQMQYAVIEPLENSIGQLQQVVQEAPILADRPQAAKHLGNLIDSGRQLLQDPENRDLPKEMDKDVEALKQDLGSVAEPKAATKAPREFKAAVARPAKLPQANLQEKMNQFVRGTEKLAKAIDNLSQAAEMPQEDIPQASIDTTPHKKTDLSKLLDAAKNLSNAIGSLQSELQPPVAAAQEEPTKLQALLKTARDFSRDMQTAAEAFQEAQEGYEDTLETLHEVYPEEKVEELLDFAFLSKAPPAPVVAQSVTTTQVYVQAVKELEVPSPVSEDVVSVHPANVLREIKEENPRSSKIPPPQNFYADILSRALSQRRTSFEDTDDVGDEENEIQVETKKVPQAPLEKKTEQRPIDEAKQKATIDKLKQKAASVPKGASLLDEIQQGKKLKATQKGEKTAPSTSKIEEELKKMVEKQQRKKP